MTHLELIATDKAYGYVFTNPALNAAIDNYRNARREFTAALAASFDGSGDDDRYQMAAIALHDATCAANAAIRDFNPA